MAGARIEIGFDDTVTRVVLGNMIRALDNPRPLLVNIREYLMEATRQRFRDQRAPDGTPWAALSPRYRKHKRKNADRILTLEGHLKNTLAGVIDDDGLAVGTIRAYGAAHQFGAKIQRQARDTTLYFKRNRDGSVGNRFVKPGRSDFAQDATIGAHATTIPARPWLGTSTEDDNYLVELAKHYLSSTVSGG